MVRVPGRHPSSSFRPHRRQAWVAAAIGRSAYYSADSAGTRSVIADQTARGQPHGGADPAGDVDLPIDARDVVLNGLAGNAQNETDHLVGLTLGHQRKDLDLPIRQLRGRSALGQLQARGPAVV